MSALFGGPAYLREPDGVVRPQPTDLEAREDGAALFAWLCCAWLPEKDPEVPPQMDEHGRIIVDEGDTIDPDAPQPIAGAGSA